MAGLLTYPTFSAFPSRKIGAVAGLLKAFSDFHIGTELQQRVLFLILTGFPFIASIHRKNNTIPKRWQSYI